MHGIVVSMMFLQLFHKQAQQHSLSVLQVRYVPAPPSPLSRGSAASTAPSLLPTRQIPSPPQHQYVPVPLTNFATGEVALLQGLPKLCVCVRACVRACVCVCVCVSVKLRVVLCCVLYIDCRQCMNQQQSHMTLVHLAAIPRLALLVPSLS